MACIFNSSVKPLRLENTCAVGFIYKKDGQSFCRVWSPLSEKIHLLITSPVERKIPMQKENEEYWYAEVRDAVPGMQYVIQVNEKEHFPDPASFRQTVSVHKSSELVDLNSYQWKDEKWKGLSMQNMIIYELHTGTFSASGTFDGIREKLNYLLELGINTIEILPIAQFPGKRNWGYDGVLPFAVQNSYGTPDQLKQLIDEAHQKGIAVLLDVVYNHFGPEGFYQENFAPYTTEKYKTPWAKALNFDDRYSDGVREYFWQNALMWLDNYHFDGLRIDAVHAIWDFGAVHFIQELNKRVRELENKTGRKKVLIAEIDLNNPRYINDPSVGGYGMDGQWSDEFHHALHSIVTGEVNGYYEDFGALSDLEKVLRDSYVYTGQYSKHRKKKFGVVPANPFHQFVVFSQNHDQVGNRMLGDRLPTTLLEKFNNEETVLNILKISAAMVLLSPYTPMLFMGEEYGEKNPFQFFTDHSDPVLIEGTREGRRKEFASFGWKAELPDPNAEETFNQCKLSFNHSDKFNKEIFDTYKFLIRFRKEHPSMRSTERKDLTVHSSSDNGLIVFDRRTAAAAVRIIINFSDQELSYDSKDFPGKRIFDSSVSITKNIKGETVSGEVKMKPFSALIIESTTSYD